MDSILPGLPDFDPRTPLEERLSQAVETNVRWTIRQLSETPEGQRGLGGGRMKIVGAIRKMETGRVRFLKQASASPPSAT